jgi:DNA ligase (NAD+)
LKLGIGDTVKVYKANMIIPQISENITQTGPVKEPQVCPVCGAHTVIHQDKLSKTLYCANANCEAQRLRGFAHFTSRDAMNIEGLSEATIEKFLKQGYLEEFSSLYHLNRYEDQIIQMEGLGLKSYNNLIRSIEKSRDVGLAQFIYALGILQVGLNTAKLICKHFNYEIEKIIDVTEDELTSIAGVGPVIAKGFSDYFSLESNKNMVNRLLSELRFHQESVSVSAQSPIVDKIFVITGDVSHFKNRKELQAKIEELGGKVTGSVSKNTDYLINNDNESGSSKNKKAKELGVQIITEEDFLKLIIEKL